MSAPPVVGALPRPFAPPRQWDGVLLPALGVAQAGALGVAAFATRDAFAALHGGAAPGAGTLAALAGAGLAAGAVDLWSRRRAEALGQSYAADLRAALYAHIAGMDRRAVAARRRGGLTLRFTGDLAAARRWYGRGLPRLIAGAIVVPGAGAVLWALDPALAMAAFPPLALALGVALWLARGVHPAQARLRDGRAALASAAIERLALAPDLDLLARTPRELGALATAGDRLAARAVHLATRLGLIRLLPQAGAVAGAAAILATAAPAGLAPATVAAGLSVLAILALPLRGLASAWDAGAAWAVAQARAQAVLAQPSQRRVVVPRGAPVALTLQDVEVAGQVVRGQVAAGDTLLITGPTASGKSDLAAILAGLDRPASGTVLYDGAPGPLPRAVLIDAQPVVLRGTLKRALALGIRPRPTATDLRRLARAFGLNDLVRHGGLDALRVTEGARTLPPGQALRLELARAALAQPDLIVIDAPRLLADPEAGVLLAALRAEVRATLVIVAPHPGDLPHGARIDLSPPPAVRRGGPVDPPVSPS